MNHAFRKLQDITIVIRAPTKSWLVYTDQATHLTRSRSLSVTASQTLSTATAIAIVINWPSIHDLTHLIDRIICPRAAQPHKIHIYWQEHFCLFTTTAPATNPCGISVRCSRRLYLTLDDSHLEHSRIAVGLPLALPPHFAVTTV